VDVHCPVCHRREHWGADGVRDVLLEGGTRRTEASATRAAFDRLALVAGGDGDGVVGACICGQPLLAPLEGAHWPQSTPFQLVLDEGELLARGTDVSLDGAAVAWATLTPAVHARFPAVDGVPATLFERLFAGSLLTFMMVPAVLWCVAVFVVFIFYNQFATYGVPGGR